jgi:hypothetical protein
MAENAGPESHYEIKKFIAICIPDMGTFYLD